MQMYNSINVLECVDEDEELEGINCTQLKAEGNCNPDYHPDAISCLKTCNLCDIDKEFSAEEETTHTSEDGKSFLQYENNFIY